MPQRAILFVDDDPMLLAGLQRSLRPMRSEWAMEFVTSGKSALEKLACSPFDVVVTDMRMPEMDGAQLLEQVRTAHPQTIRFVLSGQSDREAVLRTVAPAHQYLAKPCSADELRQKLATALALKDLLESSNLKNVVSRIKSLPSTPALYWNLLKKLESECPVDDIGAIIERDVAMTSKVLQLVNSAFFGLGHCVSSPAQAVALLGTDTIKSLVLSIGIFSQFSFGSACQREADWLWQHSVATSRMARKIAQMGGLDARAADDSFAAGLLHDVGKLVIMTERISDWKTTVATVETEKISFWSAEQKVLGCNHAQIGAYLLGLWGLPGTIVEAVAWHHNPSDSPIVRFSPLATVHLADYYHTSLEPFRPHEPAGLDAPFLRCCGLEESKPQFRTACEKLLQET
jgi:putative nucleotidyltransferase with HDIG domain